VPTPTPVIPHVTRPLVFKTHRFIEVHLTNFCMLLTIERYPPCGNYIFTTPRTCDFTNVKVPIRVPLPIRPHWGQFLRRNFIYPLACLPKLRDLRSDLRVYPDLITDKWIGPILGEREMSQKIERRVLLTNAKSVPGEFW
jgi:hypothetical protein